MKIEFKKRLIGKGILMYVDGKLYDKYDYVNMVSMNDYFVLKNNKYGIVTPENITPCEYDTCQLSGENFTVEKDGKWGLISNCAEDLIPCVADQPIFTYATYCIIEKNGKYGIFNLNSTDLVSNVENDSNFKYDTYSVSKNKRYVFVKKGKKIGVYDISRDMEIIACENEDASLLSHDCFDVVKDGKHGVIDNGDIFPHLRLDYSYDEITPTETGYIVKQNNKYGIKDSNHSNTNCDYEQVKYSHGYYITKRKGYYTVFNPDSEQIIHKKINLMDIDLFPFFNKSRIEDIDFDPKGNDFTQVSKYIIKHIKDTRILAIINKLDADLTTRYINLVNDDETLAENDKHDKIARLKRWYSNKKNFLQNYYDELNLIYQGQNDSLDLMKTGTRFDY